MISIEHLTKNYRSKRRIVKALDDVTLALPSKGMFFFLGESGAGKSTLFKILSLQEQPTTGEVRFDGKSISKLKGKERSAFRASYLAVVTQDLDIVDGLTVEENLVLAREMAGENVEQCEIARLLEKLSLPKDLLKEKPENLSGGQRQRVAIGRAMLKDSKVYLCDEPTGNLDEDNAKAVMELLKGLSEDRLVLVVSHNSHLASIYSDGIVKLEKGAVASSSLPKVNEIPGGDIKVSKTSMRLKSEAKLSVSTLKHSIKKLALTGASTILASTFILTLFSFLEFDMERAFQNAIDGEGLQVVSVLKKERLTPNSSRITPFSQEEVNEMKDFFPVCMPNYSYPSLGMIPTGKFNKENEPIYFHDYSTYFFDASKTDLQEFGFGLKGRLPGPGEIVVTFYQLVNWGLLPENATFEDATPETVPGGKIYFNDNLAPVAFEFSISGILDTKYPFFEKELSENPYVQEQPSLSQLYEGHASYLFSSEDYDFFQNRHREFKGKDAISYSGVFVPRKYATLKNVRRYSDFLHEKNTALTACLGTRLDACFSALSDTRTNWGSIMQFGSMGLALFAIFFFTSFLFSVLESGWSTWTVLNYLGAKKWNLFSILFLQSLLIAVCTVIFSFIPYGFALLGLNLSVNFAMGAAFSPFAFSAVGPFAALGGLLALGVILSFIGAIRISHQKKQKKA